MSRRQLVYEIHCDVSNLFRLEHGGRGVSADMLHNILTALDVEQRTYEDIMLAYDYAPHNFQSIAVEKLSGIS